MGQSQPCCHLRALNKAGWQPRDFLFALSREGIKELPARCKSLCTSGSRAGDTWLSWLSPRHGDRHKSTLWRSSGRQTGTRVCTNRAGNPAGSGNCSVWETSLRAASPTMNLSVLIQCGGAGSSCPGLRKLKQPLWRGNSYLGRA